MQTFILGSSTASRWDRALMVRAACRTAAVTDDVSCEADEETMTGVDSARVKGPQQVAEVRQLGPSPCELTRSWEGQGMRGGEEEEGRRGRRRGEEGKEHDESLARSG
jgi:hypothetical protein